MPIVFAPVFSEVIIIIYRMNYFSTEIKLAEGE